MRTSYVITEAVRRAGVTVYFADRAMVRRWNAHHIPREPLRFGGFYWKQMIKGKQNGDEAGPFRSRSAAIVDAYQRLQLRPYSYLTARPR